MAKPNSVIPAPPHTEEEPFEIGDTLTVFAAAMIYAGRHPHSRFLRNGSIEDHVQFMRAGIREREPRTKIRARRSWDIYCELINRIKQRRLTPVKSAYLEDGEVDPRRTVIEIADLVLLANERGEQPKYLKHLLRAADYRASKRRLTRNEAGTFTAEYIATEDVLQWPALKALLQKRSCVEVESCSATSFVKCRARGARTSQKIIRQKIIRREFANLGFSRHLRDHTPGFNANRGTTNNVHPVHRA